MNRNKLAVLTLSVLLFTLILHLFGMYDYFYVRFWFYDIIVHILGGVGIALSTLYILKDPKYIIIFVIICGILWEIFEVYYDISGSPFGTFPYFLDTVKDLVDDLIGGMFVWLSVKK